MNFFVLLTFLLPNRDASNKVFVIFSVISMDWLIFHLHQHFFKGVSLCDICSAGKPAFPFLSSEPALTIERLSFFLIFYEVCTTLLTVTFSLWVRYVLASSYLCILCFCINYYIFFAHNEVYKASMWQIRKLEQTQSLLMYFYTLHVCIYSAHKLETNHLSDIPVQTFTWHSTDGS